MNRVQKLLHDLLGWGFPMQINGGDSFQPTYKCRFCDHDLAQDSTLAYFHLSSKSV